MSATALVWFKRDLRLHDHAPLAAAQAFEHTLALYVIEPEWLDSPECDPRHVAFALGCVAELQTGLAAIGLPLLVRVGSMPQVLGDLRREFAFTHLFSHEETGPGWSYTRDKGVAAWCRELGVDWVQWAQTGVVRPLRTRTPDSHGIESALNGDGLLVARQRPSPTVFTNMTGNGLPFVEDRRSPGASRLGGRRHSVARRPTRSGRPTSFGCHASCPGGAIGSRVTQSQTSQGTIDRHRAAARHSAAARCLAWGASTPWKRIRRAAGAALARSIAVKIPARSSPAALRFGG